MGGTKAYVNFDAPAVPPFVIFKKRQASLLARFRSAQIRGFKSRTSNHRNQHSLIVAF
jgi:hypothetical protein